MLEYETLTEDELLNIVGESEQLTDEARMALEAELRRRNLSTQKIQAYAAESAAADEAEKLRRAAPKTISHGSFGRRFFGRANRRRDPSGNFELCESTLWFVVLWIPVYPIATFTVRRDLERWLGMVIASEPFAVERHSRNWEQILLTWVKAAAVLLALRLAYLFLIFHPALVRKIFAETLK